LGERLRPLRLTNSAFGCSRVTKHGNNDMSPYATTGKHKTGDAMLIAMSDVTRIAAHLSLSTWINTFLE
jgi:hypothetical protein